MEPLVSFSSVIVLDNPTDFDHTSNLLVDESPELFRRLIGRIWSIGVTISKLPNRKCFVLSMLQKLKKLHIERKGN